MCLTTTYIIVIVIDNVYVIEINNRNYKNKEIKTF